MQSCSTSYGKALQQPRKEQLAKVKNLVGTSEASIVRDMQMVFIAKVNNFVVESRRGRLTTYRSRSHNGVIS